MTLYTIPLEKEINASDFGIVGDGVADDTAAIQAALDRAGALLDQGQAQGRAGKSIVHLAGGSYKITSTLTVRNGTTLKGETLAPPYPNRDSGFKSNENLFTGTEIVCDEAFSGEYAIVLEPDNTNLQNIILDGHSIPTGTTYPQIICRTAGGGFVNSSAIPLVISDPNDFRQGVSGITNVEIPFFQNGVYMEYQLAAQGMEAPFTFSLTNGSFPNGISINSDGLISGTPAAIKGKWFPEITVTDSRTNPGPRQKSKVFTVGVIYDEIEDFVANIPTVGSDFSYTFSTRNNKPDIVWRAEGLPSFMSINEQTGELTAPSSTTSEDVQFWEYTVFLYYRNPNGSGSRGDDILLDRKSFKGELRFADDSIRIVGGQAFRVNTTSSNSRTYLGNGGYGSYTWSISSVRTNTEFPGNATTTTSTSPFSGLNLNTSTGEISGTPTTTGNNTYYLRATSTVDSDIFFEAQYRIISKVEGTQPRLISRSLPAGSPGVPYSFQWNVENVPNAGAYTYEGVSLPSGLSIDENTGLISGTPVGANYVQGVRVQWSDSVVDCAIRGFQNGAGIISTSASNLHRIKGCIISTCDSGIRSIEQTWDSHFTDLYIHDCRVGFSFGSGTAGCTFTSTRIEFIHEYGITAKTSHENDYSAVYFDTCGFSSVNLIDCHSNVFSGCRFYRSGRVVRGSGTKLFTEADRRYSNHMYLENCKGVTISGCAFNAGSASEGATESNGIFVSDRVNDFIRPFTGIRLKNCTKFTCVGNYIGGAVNNACEADLTRFGENYYTGFNFNDNTQTTNTFLPIDKHIHDQEIVIPNANFQVWQRDESFTLPPKFNGGNDLFPVADFWSVRRGGSTVMDQDINVTKGTDGPVGDGSYIHITKANNTTNAPGDNFQNLQLESNVIKGLEKTNSRAVILSYYAYSDQTNTVQVFLNQYGNSSYDQFKVYNHSVFDLRLNRKWQRYEHYMELTAPVAQYPASALNSKGAGLYLEIRMDKWDQQYDVKFTGFQIDFVDKNPFGDALKLKPYEEELAQAQLKYQTSMEPGFYMPSWSGGYRYDNNGANWGEGFIQAYAPSTEPAAMRSVSHFNNPIPNPGHANTLGGNIPNFKILNPTRLDQRTHVDKYKFTNGVEPRIEYITPHHFEVSGRNSSTNPVANTNPSAHWIYTEYPTDLDSDGGGYS